MKQIPVLLIDDDIELCSSLLRLLTMESFSVTAEHNAESGAREALAGNFQLIILDVMLPDGDGLAVLRRLRIHSQTPVIMLTARGDEADRIAGLEGGADDYLPKPFNARELVARMRAVLKRRGDSALPGLFKLADLEIDRKQRRVLLGGEELTLTGAEFDILLVLARSAGNVLSRDEIAEAALRRSLGFFDRSIDNHISNLRKKLGADGRHMEWIRNVRGAGYVFIAEPERDDGSDS